MKVISGFRHPSKWILVVQLKHHLHKLFSAVHPHNSSLKMPAGYKHDNICRLNAQIITQLLNTLSEYGILCTYIASAYWH